MTWMQTISGKKFQLTEPRKEDVDFADIAYALSHLCRFAGHTKKFYSVAQHSCIVASLLPKSLKLYGLLHDAHEAYIGDITSPVKEALGSMGRQLLHRIEEGICRAIFDAAKLEWPSPAVYRAVKYADLVALQTERRDLLNPCSERWDAGLDRIEPMAEIIRPWMMHQYAEQQFLRDFTTYSA